MTLRTTCLNVGAMNELIDVLKRLRKKKWTVTAIAEEIGTTQRTINRWENGINAPVWPSSIIEALERLEETKPPLQRRYTHVSGGRFSDD